MKKIVFTLIVALLCSGLAFGANDGQKGYRADVTLSGSLGSSADLMPFLVSLETGHGYAFGNGWYVGGGTGIELYTDVYYYVPLFSEVRYFVPGTPLFLDGKLGAEFSSGYGLSQPLLLAEGGAGLMAGKWSFSLSLRRLSLGRSTIPVSSMDNLRIGVGYHF